MLPQEVSDWLESRGHAISDLSPVSGGCINTTVRVACRDGSAWFVKINRSAPSGMFQGEAAGLDALAQAGGPRIPSVHLICDHSLVMEDLPSGPRQADYWERFGRELAQVHAHQAKKFGFGCDTWCGDIRQPNQWCADGFTFYAEQRFGFQAKLAHQRGHLNRLQVQAIERFADRLPDLVPVQGPALLHGDLWSGNAHVDPTGAPALIDPACYYGWPEADLAMTQLFGGFPEAFYRAYEASGQVADDWRNRVDLHNVYHLLNHANIFGGGYAGQALAIVCRYC